jgi:hypothetical protein
MWTVDGMGVVIVDMQIIAGFLFSPSASSPRLVTPGLS